MFRPPRVSAFKGHTLEQKRDLVRELTDAFVRACGGKREGLLVITEIDKQDWASGGELSVDKNPKKMKGA